MTTKRTHGGGGASDQRPVRARKSAAKPGGRAAKPAKTPGAFPSREDILAFVAENPGKAGKREVARHFGIVGAARIQLKRILKDLAEEGVVEKRQKRLIRPGDLP
ncbi:MAG: ribonuclease R, partial [Polymorphum sp.]|nr:ribonuclease R [Polymorphum sp.]